MLNKAALAFLIFILSHFHRLMRGAKCQNKSAENLQEGNFQKIGGGREKINVVFLYSSGLFLTFY